MNLHEAIEDISNITNELINTMTESRAQDLGLDPRSCYGTIYVSDEGLAVEKHNDRGLQYYGGFEYVDADDRYELGEYVFYTADSDRVRDCIECFEAKTEEA
jgi:hypothetical protein|tara:strand:+ start:1517 stop:1822 length:306 start_codon:yes stop_codon:yes gene_type:complete